MNLEAIGIVIALGILTVLVSLTTGRVGYQDGLAECEEKERKAYLQGVTQELKIARGQAAKTMIFWAVEEGKLVKYRRTGKCNQCGACCRDYHIGFQMEVGFVSNKNYEKQEDWSEREGWSMFVAQGTWWYFKIFEVTPADKEWHCRALTEDNKCSEWKTEKFRPICRYWPMHPSNLKHFPECGFSFEKIELEED